MSQLHAHEGWNGQLRVCAAALFAGVFLTLLHSFRAPKADAHVFLGIGPAFVLGGIVSGVLASALGARGARPPERRERSADQPPALVTTADDVAEGDVTQLVDLFAG